MITQALVSRGWAFVQDALELTPRLRIFAPKTSMKEEEFQHFTSGVTPVAPQAVVIVTL
jgi:hypothetical protein